jgi:hypothetical protein
MFEEHYFQCDQCAEDVRNGMAFADNVRSVFAEEAPAASEAEEDRDRARAKPQVWQETGRGWLVDWLRPSSLVPMAAAVSLAFITSYQSLVTLPAMRRMAVPAMSAPLVLANATRGELPVLTTGGGGPAALALYTNGLQGQLTFQVRSQDDAVVHSGSGPAPAPGAPLVVFVPPAGLNDGETYRIVLRGETGGTAGEYRFTVAKK